MCHNYFHGKFKKALVTILANLCKSVFSLPWESTQLLGELFKKLLMSKIIMDQLNHNLWRWFLDFVIFLMILMDIHSWEYQIYMNNCSCNNNNHSHLLSAPFCVKYCTKCLTYIMEFNLYSKNDITLHIRKLTQLLFLH